jgi:hypothetical protein
VQSKDILRSFVDISKLSQVQIGFVARLGYGQDHYDIERTRGFRVLEIGGGGGQTK